MFQFPGFALLTLYIQVESTCFTRLLITRRLTITEYQVGCPIRKSMDQSSFSAPHGLSQSITSFIASCCQGIHQTPFSRLIRSRRRQASQGPEAVHSRHRRWFTSVRLVSVLDLEQHCGAGQTRRTRPHSGTAPQCRCCFSLHDVNSVRQDDRRPEPGPR